MWGPIGAMFAVVTLLIGCGAEEGGFDRCNPPRGEYYFTHTMLSGDCAPLPDWQIFWSTPTSSLELSGCTVSTEFIERGCGVRDIVTCNVGGRRSIWDTWVRCQDANCETLVGDTEARALAADGLLLCESLSTTEAWRID